MAGLIAILAGLSSSQWIAIIKLLPIVIQLLQRMLHVVEPALKADIEKLLTMAHESQKHYQNGLRVGWTQEQAAHHAQTFIPEWEKRWMDRASGGPNA